MKYIVVLLISFYQKFISPYKGFRCAYAVLHGGDSCSEAIKKIVLAKGCIGGYQETRERFKACKAANETLIRNLQRRDKNRCDDCPDCGCDCIEACSSGKSGKGDCGSYDMPDISCDLPCDCSF